MNILLVWFIKLAFVWKTRIESAVIYFILFFFLSNQRNSTVIICNKELCGEETQLLHFI